jgi:reactive intermediate/imine deaminase
MLKTINAEDAPAPHGHYAHAIRHGETVYVSGQLGVSGEEPNPEAIGVSQQVEYALGNVETILRADDCARNDVVKVTIYVTDIALWPEANAAFAKFFGSHRPARSVVPCPSLHLGAKIEMDVIAAKRGIAITTI